MIIGRHASSSGEFFGNLPAIVLGLHLGEQLRQVALAQVALDVGGGTGAPGGGGRTGAPGGAPGWLVPSAGRALSMRFSSDMVTSP